MYDTLYKMLVNDISFYIYRHKKKLCVALLLTCCGWITFHYFTRSGLASLKEMECSHSDSEIMIQELCSLYMKGKVIGDMCQDMCYKGNIRFKRCLNYKGGKHVLLVDCSDSCEAGQTIQAVLKMNHIKDKDMVKHFEKVDRELYELFTYIKVFDGNAHPIDYWIDGKILAHKTKEMLMNEYGNILDDTEDVFNLLWGGNHKTFQEMNDDNPAYPVKFVRTLWSLLAQNEYKISVVFEKYNIFPKIYGFCGPVYLSEHAPFDQRLDRRVQNFEIMTWRKRVTTAIHILNLVHAAEDMPTPLQFCDVKTPHFGTNKEGEIRFTDSDTIFTNETMSAVLKETPCASDKDCALFDCLGVCNSETELCESFRTNNNLQCVCSRILEDKKQNVFEGILANPPSPVANSLRSLLKQCASGVTERRGGVSMRRPSNEILKKLTNLLLESLEY